MAERFAKDIVEKNHLNIDVISRGISAVEGERANIKAINALRPYLLSLEGHRSSQLKREDFIDDMIILTMTNKHKEHILYHYNNMEGKVYTLKEYAGFFGEVRDPYGSSQEIYNLCAKELFELIDGILKI